MITLYRTYFEDRTEGELLLPDGTALAVLERPWVNNKPFVSCIPEDIYRVRRNTTGKHQYYELLDVLNRRFIEIHVAYKVSELQGCLAPCLELVDGRTKGSPEACQLLLDWFEDNDWVLEIKERELG